MPVPRDQVSADFNPGLLLDYDRFCSDSASSFVDEQVAILRAAIGPGAFITTNLYPPPISNAIDIERLTRGMDFASWNNYPSWGEQESPALCRPGLRRVLHPRHLAAGPFTVMETFSGIQGHVCLGHLPPERRSRSGPTRPSRGAPTGSSISAGGRRPTARSSSATAFSIPTTPRPSAPACFGKNMREVKAPFSRFASTPMESPACLVYSKDDARVLSEQYLSKGLYFKPVEWAQAGYDMEMVKWFAPYVVFNVNADVKSVDSVDWTSTRSSASPSTRWPIPSSSRGSTPGSRKGGHLVLGYRSGARDMRDWKSQPCPASSRRWPESASPASSRSIRQRRG